MLTIDHDLCIGCGLCEAQCPFGALSFVDERLQVNDTCTLCGACVEACEVEALRIEVNRAEGVAGSLEDWQGVFVVGEIRDGQPAPVTYELLGAGRTLADKRKTSLTVVLLGHQLDQYSQRLIASGADTVLLADDPRLASFREDSYARCLEWIFREYQPEVVLAGATAMGRSVIPYVANAMNAGLTADCTNLDIRPEDGILLQTRPAFGGNIMATIECPQHRPQMATVRPKVMSPAPVNEERSGQVVSLSLNDELLASLIEVVESVHDGEEKVNIQEAEILVAGGRGVESEKGFTLIRELAKELGASVAASRAAVDSEWIPYAHQVGQTGKTVCPKIYIACGISGAVQHAVGMQSAETIIAINRDEKAPIFDIATYGVVGDLFEILPKLVQYLQEK